MVIYGAPDKTAYQAWWGFSRLQPANPREARTLPSALADFTGTISPPIPSSSTSTVPETRKFRLWASFWEATRIALDSLRKNKLRSFLTLLGIILATTTLIAVTALIDRKSTRLNSS